MATPDGLRSVWIHENLVLGGIETGGDFVFFRQGTAPSSSSGECARLQFRTKEALDQMVENYAKAMKGETATAPNGRPFVVKDILNSTARDDCSRVALVTESGVCVQDYAEVEEYDRGTAIPGWARSLSEKAFVDDSQIRHVVLARIQQKKKGGAIGKIVADQKLELVDSRILLEPADGAYDYFVVVARTLQNQIVVPLKPLKLVTKQETATQAQAPWSATMLATNGKKKDQLAFYLSDLRLPSLMIAWTGSKSWLAAVKAASARRGSVRQMIVDSIERTTTEFHIDAELRRQGTGTLDDPMIAETPIVKEFLSKSIKKMHETIQKIGRSTKAQDVWIRNRALMFFDWSSQQYVPRPMIDVSLSQDTVSASAHPPCVIEKPPVSKSIEEEKARDKAKDDIRNRVTEQTPKVQAITTAITALLNTEDPQALDGIIKDYQALFAAAQDTMESAKSTQDQTVIDLSQEHLGLVQKGLLMVQNWQHAIQMAINAKSKRTQIQDTQEYKKISTKAEFDAINKVLAQELVDARKERNDVLSVLGEKHPLIVELDKWIAEIESHMTAAENALDDLKQRALRAHELVSEDENKVAASLESFKTQEVNADSIQKIIDALKFQLEASKTTQTLMIAALGEDKGRQAWIDKYEKELNAFVAMKRHFADIEELVRVTAEAERLATQKYSAIVDPSRTIVPTTAAGMLDELRETGLEQQILASQAAMEKLTKFFDAQHWSVKERQAWLAQVEPQVAEHKADIDKLASVSPVAPLAPSAPSEFAPVAPFAPSAPSAPSVSTATTTMRPVQAPTTKKLSYTEEIRAAAMARAQRNIDANERKMREDAEKAKREAEAKANETPEQLLKRQLAANRANIQDEEEFSDDDTTKRSGGKAKKIKKRITRRKK